MYVTKEKQNIYLDSWNYNAVLTLAALREKITAAGGRVKPVTAVTIHNYSYDDEIHENAARIERLKSCATLNPENAAKRAAVVKALEAKNAELEKQKPAPVVLPCASWITFELSGNACTISLDSNPFFPFYFSKTPINAAGEYSCDAGLEEMSKNDFPEEMLSRDFTQDQREAVAAALLDWIKAAPVSKIIWTVRRQRVPNRYNNSYHYEMIYDKERRAKIDF